MAVCYKCGVEKPIEQFGKSKICKDCQHIIWKARTDRMTNDKIIELENSECKTCKICGKDKSLRAYPIDRSHKDGHKSWCMLCNIIKTKEYEDGRKDYHTNYRAEHKSQYSKYHKDQLHQLKTLVITYYGNGECKCVKCGFTDLRALTIDHIDGHGNQHRKENHTHTGLHFYKWLINNNYPTGFRTLCCNCQSIVEHERRLPKQN